jgi:hypothetical protein
MHTVVGLVTRRDDHTIPLLADALSARGARFLGLYTETFPTESSLDVTLGPDGFRGRLTNQDGQSVDLHDIHALWLKRWDVGLDLRSHDLPPSIGTACRQEADALLRGVLTDLAAPMVNDLHAVVRAEEKVWQLSRAARFGLPMPATHFTNRPGTGATFAAAFPHLITKRMGTSYVRAESGRRQLMNTASVQPEDLASLDEGLALAPVTLQARVEKRREARATLVGDRIFASAVDSTATDGAETDWRVRADVLMDRFTPIELPDALKEQLVAFHRSIGLSYAGIDLIQQPDGAWVFLETNPSGEWHWIHNSGHDVAGALADHLLAAR